MARETGSWTDSDEATWAESQRGIHSRYYKEQYIGQALSCHSAPFLTKNVPQRHSSLARSTDTET